MFDISVRYRWIASGIRESPNAADGVEVVWWPFVGKRDKEEGGVVIVLILVLVKPSLFLCLFLIAFLESTHNSKQLYFFQNLENYFYKIVNF